MVERRTRGDPSLGGEGVRVGAGLSLGSTPKTERGGRSGQVNGRSSVLVKEF